MNLKSIVHIVLKEYALPWHGVHGVSHWARVLENGLRLAEHTGARSEVVQLFALLHDARRINEGVDDGHGWRGADMALRLRGSDVHLADSDFDLLYAACAGHTDGQTEADVTIQTCWDADRQDLGRVGISPVAHRLCTDAAKRPEILRWADGRACFRVMPELIASDWELQCGIHT